jgi:hypothetical protein
MSTPQTRISRKEEQRKSHVNFDTAKQDVERKCNLYPGYRAVVENVRDVLKTLDTRRVISVFDMDHGHSLTTRNTQCDESN